MAKNRGTELRSLRLRADEVNASTVSRKCDLGASPTTVERDAARMVPRRGKRVPRLEAGQAQRTHDKDLT